MEKIKMMIKKQKMIVNVYGDESCYLEHDKLRVMVLGAIICEKTQVKRITKEIRRLKKRYGLKKDFEIKWTKVSQAKIDFYRDLIKFFFQEPALRFRGLVVPDKSKLKHNFFKQTHDEWYYKMYFETLKIVFERQNNYHLYLDIKDTLGGKKLKRMRAILNDGSKTSSVKVIQLVRSNEVLLLQLADLLIGALSYQARNLQTSEAKNCLEKLISGNLGYPLSLSSPKKEKKFNCLVWEAQK